MKKPVLRITFAVQKTDFNQNFSFSLPAHAFFFNLHHRLFEKEGDNISNHSKPSQSLFGIPSWLHRLHEKPNLFEKLAQRNEKLAEKFEEKLEKLGEKLEAQFGGKNHDRIDEKMWSLLEEKFNKPPSRPKPTGYSPSHNCRDDCNDDCFT